MFENQGKYPWRQTLLLKQINSDVFHFGLSSLKSREVPMHFEYKLQASIKELLKRWNVLFKSSWKKKIIVKSLVCLP